MRLTRRAGIIVIFVLAFAEAGFASSLENYRQRVKAAVNTLQTIRDAEESALGQSESIKLANIRAVREALAPKETIEWNGTKFFVDNAWLDEQLKEFEREGATTSTRLSALTHAQERLLALNERLNEIDPRGADSFTKSEMRDRLASILQRSEYQRVAQGESALQRLLRLLERLIARLFPKQSPIGPSGANAISRIAQILVILIALAAISYAVWLFAPRILKRRQRKKTVKQTARVVLGEQLEPDQSAADLLAEAEALARSGDLRGAIRRGYIALLVELADRKMISLAQHKTNRDYLRSVKGIGNLHRKMESLTNNFELHWYGLVPAEEHDWIAFRAGYKDALTSS